MRVLYNRPQDDYSFDPLSTDNGYTGKTNFDYGDAADNTFYSNWPRTTHTPIPAAKEPTRPHHRGDSDGLMDDEIPNPIKALKLPLQESRQEQTIFAPPGKVGVAIDVIDGRPVVHKVKKGSPLEGLLMPNDSVLSIDGVDTTCMTAAEITQLMVKRMNHQRRITFVREP